MKSLPRLLLPLLICAAGLPRSSAGPETPAPPAPPAANPPAAAGSAAGAPEKKEEDFGPFGKYGIIGDDSWQGNWPMYIPRQQDTPAYSGNGWKVYVLPTKSEWDRAWYMAPSELNGGFCLEPLHGVGSAGGPYIVPRPAPVREPVAEKDALIAALREKITAQEVLIAVLEKRIKELEKK